MARVCAAPLLPNIPLGIYGKEGEKETMMSLQSSIINEAMNYEVFFLPTLRKITSFVKALQKTITFLSPLLYFPLFIL